MPVLNWNISKDQNYLECESMDFFQRNPNPNHLKVDLGFLVTMSGSTQICLYFLIWQKLVWSESRFYLNWSESGFHLNQSESGSYLNRSESGFCSDHLKDCIWIDPGSGFIKIPDGFNQNFIWRDLNPDTEHNYEMMNLTERLSRSFPRYILRI